MRGKKFGWVLTGASAAGGILAAVLMGLQMKRAVDTPGSRVLWMGAFFLMIFLLGFAALQLTMLLDKSYKVQRPALWPVAFVLACVLVFGIGAGGQYLFMLSTEEVEVAAEVDMVLLLDASSSMGAYGYDGARTDAACQFVKSLEENCRLQSVSFAGTVIDSTQLMKMTDKNKDRAVQMISDIDSIGSTDFNEPLRMAMSTLEDKGRSDCGKAVILLTDGQSDLDAQVVADYVDSDIMVFTIRISGAGSLSGQEQALVDLARDTGGEDTQLTPRADGSIDAKDMLDAFRDAFEASSETNVTMREDLIVYAGDGITLWQFVIRAVVLALCAAVIGAGYFAYLDLSAVANGVMGLIAAVLVTLIEGAGFALCAGAVCLLVGTAYVFLDLRGEDHYDV